MRDEVRAVLSSLVPLAELKQRLKQLPKGKPVVAEWRAKGLPVER